MSAKKIFRRVHWKTGKKPDQHGPGTLEQMKIKPRKFPLNAKLNERLKRKI